MESLKRLQSLALLGDAQACEELKRAYERAVDLEGWRAFLRDLDTEGLNAGRLRVRLLASLYQEPFDWVKFCELVEQESGEGRISLVAWLQPLVLKTNMMGEKLFFFRFSPNCSLTGNSYPSRYNYGLYNQILVRFYLSPTHWDWPVCLL